MIHLTLTGPNAGQAICMLDNGLPEWGADPLPPGDRGVHLAYAPQAMIDGSHPDVCQTCVETLKRAEASR